MARCLWVVSLITVIIYKVFVYFIFSCSLQFPVISYLHVHTDERVSLGKQYPYNGYEQAGNPERVPDPPITLTPPPEEQSIPPPEEQSIPPPEEQSINIPYSVYCCLIFSLPKNVQV